MNQPLRNHSLKLLSLPDGRSTFEELLHVPDGRGTKPGRRQLRDFPIGFCARNVCERIELTRKLIPYRTQHSSKNASFLSSLVNSHFDTMKTLNSPSPRNHKASKAPSPIHPLLSSSSIQKLQVSLYFHITLNVNSLTRRPRKHIQYFARHSFD